MREVTTGTYASNPPQLGAHNRTAAVLPFNPLRTGLRMAEQVLSNALYGGR